MKREKGVQNSEEGDRRACREPEVCLLVHLGTGGKASMSGLCPPTWHGLGAPEGSLKPLFPFPVLCHLTHCACTHREREGGGSGGQ